MKPGSLTRCLSSLRQTASRMIDSSSASLAPSRSGSRRSVSRSENRQVRSLPVGGQPDPVAVGAERLRDRVDEPDLAAPAVGEPVDARGRVRLARQRLERVAGLDQRPQLGAGQNLVGAPGAVAVERHELDEPHLVVARARQLAEAEDLVLGEVAHRDRVDLDRPDALVRGDRREPAQDLWQRVAAGDLVEAVAGQRVDRDVDPVDAGVDERRRIALEQVAVGGQREVVDSLDRAQHRDQARELAARQRLAAGQPHVGDPEPGEERDQALDLLEARGPPSAPATASPRPACSSDSGSCSGR